MPTIAMSLWKCTAYIVRATVLLAILAEAYSFINPSNYSVYYDTLWSRQNESYLYVILAAIEDTIRLIFKAVSFSLSAECALWIFGGDWGTAEIDTPCEWGMVYYLDLPIGVYAFRWAIQRDFSVARWFIWYTDVINRVLDWLGGFAIEAENWVGAE
ncbi:hypothetical protein MBLNU13_g05600t1 [Cladosporium sp. NU13]